ncbi:hypothetical protein RIF29_26438 [Crotalaria pallida]|uniref:Transmembrane protein n=1 Tax=Crotalaria pallida TaxID=3830 RepID=A0AAN9EMQ6_CROPI
MPLLPWKKHKVTPLPQIAANHQLPPKSTSSLVVQNVFQPSLVKNRTHFRIHKSKKPVYPENSHPARQPPPSALSPASPPPGRLSSSDFSVQGLSLTSSVIRKDDVFGGDGVAGSGREVNRVDECESGPGSKSVLGAVFFVFVVVVVVLITSVKEVTVGIVVLALLLVFIENAGKRVVSFFRPLCSSFGMIIECLKERVSKFVLFEKVMLKINENWEGSESLIVRGECSSSNISLSFEEIEVVENKSDICCGETCFFGGPKLENEEKKMQVEDDSNVIEDACEICYQCKTKDRRSVKLKSKMVKKLVLKKLRGSKKDKKGKKNEERKDEATGEGYYSTCNKEDKSMKFEIEEEQGGVVFEQEYIREEEFDDDGITCTLGSLLAWEEEEEEEEEVVVDMISEEKKRIDRVENSGYTTFFVIALVGLVSGRLPAMMLVVTWCFILKMVRTQGKSLNMPVIRCSVPNS